MAHEVSCGCKTQTCILTDVLTGLLNTNLSTDVSRYQVLISVKAIMVLYAHVSFIHATQLWARGLMIKRLHTHEDQKRDTVKTLTSIRGVSFLCIGHTSRRFINYVWRIFFVNEDVTGSDTDRVFLAAYGVPSSRRCRAEAKASQTHFNRSSAH